MIPQILEAKSNHLAGMCHLAIALSSTLQLAGTAGGRRPLVQYCLGDEPFFIRAA